jgi:NAD(P)-dependent dehydrogenase (short-subunit alcohol dehydrogenase family)
MTGLSRFLFQKWNLPADETTSFAGKTVLITGGTSGLGLEAAQKIAALNPSKLIITARDVKKGQLAKEQIVRFSRTAKRSTGVADVDVTVCTLKMDDFASVKAFAKEICADVPVLHAVILNVGLTNRAWSKSVEGWEDTLQVNTLSTTLLALSLLPKLLSTASVKVPAHLTVISSGLAREVKPDFARKYYDSPSALQAMSAEKAWPGGPIQYGLSKLLLEYSMRKIATCPSVAPPSGVTVVINSACPGMCKTNLARQYTEKNILFRIIVWVSFLFFGRSAEAGSRTYVSALTQGPESQGRMWKDDRYYDGGEMVESADGQRFAGKMWKEVVGVMEAAQPKVTAILAAG